MNGLLWLLALSHLLSPAFLLLELLFRLLHTCLGVNRGGGQEIRTQSCAVFTATSAEEIPRIADLRSRGAAGGLQRSKIASFLVAEGRTGPANEYDGFHGSRSPSLGPLPSRGHDPLVSTRFGVALMCTLFLYVCGTAFYMHVEHLSLLDACYCTTGVLTTVGLVVVPKTPMGRFGTAVFNVISLGLGVIVLSEIADWRHRSARAIISRHPSLSRFVKGDTLLLLVATVAPLITAATAFRILEKWSFGESLYFCLITASGLGMGDVEPRQAASKMIFILYLWFSMGITLSLLGTYGHLIHEYFTGVVIRVSAAFSAARGGREIPVWSSGAGGGGMVLTPSASMASTPNPRKDDDSRSLGSSLPPGPPSRGGMAGGSLTISSILRAGGAAGRGFFSESPGSGPSTPEVRVHEKGSGGDDV